MFYILNIFYQNLSRRCITYVMSGLSFREYLCMFHQQYFKAHTLKEILSDGNSICADVCSKIHPLPLFADYLQKGYYPFLIEGGNNYYMRIENVVDTILEVELPQLRKLDLGNVIPKLSLKANKNEPIKRDYFIPVKNALAEPNFRKRSRRMGMWRLSLVTKKRTISFSFLPSFSR